MSNKSKFSFYILFLFSTLLLSKNAMAQDNEMLDKLNLIQQQWGVINYQSESGQAQMYQALIKESDALSKAYPNQAEPIIWHAINLASYAGAVGGIKSLTKALPAAKKAKKLLLESIEIDPTALNYSAYNTLGTLYSQVPGWPIAFGNDKKAREYLELAYEKSQHGLGPSFFYGKFLLDQKETDKGIKTLEEALKSPPLEGRPIADKGRRDEIRALLSKIKS